ncbi:transposase [Streptomyces sp. NPDC002004]
MSGRFPRRPLALAVVSLTLAAGTACAVHVSPGSPTGTGHVAAVGHDTHCGRQGDGGAGGRGGEPGRPGDPGEPGGPRCPRYGALPDGTKDDLTAKDRVRIVLAVMSGHVTRAEVADRYKIPAAEVDDWRQEFLDGDWYGLMGDDTTTSAHDLDALKQKLVDGDGTGAMDDSPFTP